jgi:hypothetical protein
MELAVPATSPHTRLENLAIVALLLIGHFTATLRRCGDLEMLADVF